MEKRNICALLAAAMLVSITASSCGSQDGAADVSVESADETGTSADTTAADTLEDGLGDADFGGYDFRISSSVFLEHELGTYIVTDELNGDIVNDELYNSRVKTEERFNCKISVKNDGNDVDAQLKNFKNSVNAGD